VDDWLAMMSARETPTGMVGPCRGDTCRPECRQVWWGYAMQTPVGQNAELEGDALSDWQPM